MRIGIDELFTMKKAAYVFSILAVFLGCGGSREDHSSHRASDVKTTETAKTNQNEAPEIERVKSDAGNDGMVFIEGGTFKMGTDKGMPSESPVRAVSVESFWMDKTEVTVAEFEKFVRATGYVTEGEKIGWSGVFSTEAASWTRCDGVSWRNPDCGDRKPKPNEPVTQISWNDARAFAKWAKKRLPTEAEFEYAARGGLEQNEYSWGDELKPNGKPAANWWQGEFPVENKKEDGYHGRAPVMSFAPNGYGLYDMAGNVWEWTADWYADDYYRWGKTNDPAGPISGEEKTMRGGSWLCAENYCTNYRAAGRSHSPIDTSLNNLGFRLVRDE